MTPKKYVVITPARDEEKYLQKTIDSMITQTILPLQWVIVNDGSQDRTQEIGQQAACKYPWIKIISRQNRGFRKAGGGVVETFYDGYELIKDLKYDFIVKLDGDLSFDPDYFEKCFNFFDTCPKIGIAGGEIFNFIDGQLIKEASVRFHVRGATKIYKKECWDAIGGLLHAPGWDTLDEAKANMKGFETVTIENLPVVHYRYTGAADGTWKNWVKNGRANFITGYHPLFFLSKCMLRIFQKPFGIISLALMWGFISAYFDKTVRLHDKDLIRFIQKQQLNRLLFKKSIWK